MCSLEAIVTTSETDAVPPSLQTSAYFLWLPVNDSLKRRLPPAQLRVRTMTSWPGRRYLAYSSGFGRLAGAGAREDSHCVEQRPSRALLVVASSYVRISGQRGGKANRAELASSGADRHLKKLRTAMACQERRQSLNSD